MLLVIIISPCPLYKGQGRNLRLQIRNKRLTDEIDVFNLLYIMELATDFISLLWLLKSTKSNVQASSGKFLEQIFLGSFLPLTVFLSSTLIYLFSYSPSSLEYISLSQLLLILFGMRWNIIN